MSQTDYPTRDPFAPKSKANGSQPVPPDSGPCPPLPMSTVSTPQPAAQPAVFTPVPPTWDYVSIAQAISQAKMETLSPEQQTAIVVCLEWMRDQTLSLYEKNQNLEVSLSRRTDELTRRETELNGKLAIVDATIRMSSSMSAPASKPRRWVTW
jgi:hypothetical protein